jgi:hypothetical protein
MKKAAITSIIFVVVSMLGSCQPAPVPQLAIAAATMVHLESSAAPC